MHDEKLLLNLIWCHQLPKFVWIGQKSAWKFQPKKIEAYNFTIDGWVKLDGIEINAIVLVGIDRWTTKAVTLSPASDENLWKF